MVFVTVGNATQGFRRLLEAVDTLAQNGTLGAESVFVQSGHMLDFRPAHCACQQFLPMDEFARLLEEASLVICHGGTTVMSVIRLGKVPVVMPRRKKYGEHTNDHQMEYVKALAAEGWIVPAYEPEDLPGAVAEARRRNAQQAPPPPSRMLSLVAQAIQELSARSSR